MSTNACVRRQHGAPSFFPSSMWLESPVEQGDPTTERRVALDRPRPGRAQEDPPPSSRKEESSCIAGRGEEELHVTRTCTRCPWRRRRRKKRRLERQGRSS
eukprot:scaffold1554_cov332-Pavlova_lutheri.AAC.20